MPAIPGSVRVGGFIAPSLTSDPYATHDDHYGLGGYRPVADITARDAITAERRKEGMWVKVLADGKVYTLSGGILNANWVEQTMGGGTLLEGVCELVDADRDVLPADNRLFLESDAVESETTPITMTIDQAEFSLDDDEGWQITFRVGQNDDGDPVPVYAACSTNEMSADDTNWLTSMYCEEVGGYLTVRYAYAGSRRGRFTVVAGRGLWRDDLGGIHDYSSSPALNYNTTYYVDGSAGDDSNDGQSWATAKQTFGFLLARAVDAIPREINGTFTCYYRGDIRARDGYGHLYFDQFYGNGQMEFVGTLTSEETLTCSTYQNNGAVRYGRISVTDGTKAWTPGQWRRHFLKIAGDDNYYPIYDNDATTLYFPRYVNITGTPAAAIYSAPELLSEIVGDPGVKYTFGVSPSVFFGVYDCTLPIWFRNLWVDEAIVSFDVPYFDSNSKIFFTSIAFTSLNVFNTKYSAFADCYFNLSAYGWKIIQFSAANYINCVFDSLDDAGYGLNVYNTSYVSLLGVIFNRQYIGLYPWSYGEVSILNDVTMLNCDTGVALASGMLALYNNSGGPELRFDTCTTGIMGNGTLVHFENQVTEAWGTGTEIKFGDTDTGGFDELNSDVLQSREGLSVVYSNSDFDIIKRDEYNNTSSGLTAVRYQTAIDEIAASVNAINVDITYYVDGTTGNDANDGLAWGTAKKTLGFLTIGEVDALPREINADVIIYVRNDIRARNVNGHLALHGFYGGGTLTVEGMLTAVTTFTATGYENDRTVRGSRQWVSDATKAWTPNEWRRHFVDLGHTYKYPIRTNNATTLFMGFGDDQSGSYASTIYSAPGVLRELDAAPGLKQNFAYDAWANISTSSLSITLKNLWLDEDFGLYGGMSVRNCRQINIENVSLMAIFAFNTFVTNLGGCYVNLINYQLVGVGDGQIFIGNSAIDSTDSTGYGIFLYHAGECEFAESWVGHQLQGLWSTPVSRLNVNRDLYIQDCTDAIVMDGGALCLFMGSDPLGLRFDTVGRAIVGNGIIAMEPTATILGWACTKEIVFSDTDEGTFADFNTQTLQSRVSLQIAYTDVDYFPVLLPEYDNTTSGLTAVRYQTAIDELAAAGGGGPVTPEFVFASPLTIDDGDHNRAMVSTVIAGLTVILPSTITPGTTVYIGSMGFDVTFLPGSGGTFVGAGPMQSAVGLQLQDNGSSLSLLFLGTPIATPLWAVIGGQGIVYVTNGGGTPTGAYHVFDSGSPVTVTLAETAIDLVDETDFTAAESSPYITEGAAYTVEVTPTTATGTLTVVLYQDAARLEPVYTLVVDLSDADTYRSAEPFGFELETAGTLYGTAFVTGVGVSETFDITIKAIGLQPLASPIPIATPYGDGIEDDGTGKPRVALPSDGGLQFATGHVKLKPDLTAAVYPTLSAAGVAIANAVTTTTDEVVAAKKMFDAVGCTPLAGSGAPVAGTYETGQEILDTNGIKYRCTGAGTPGTWELADSVGDAQADYATDSLIPGAVETLEILTTGDVGMFQLVQVWAAVADPDNYATDFRLRIYRTADGYGRDVMWQASGTARQSYLTAILPASQDYVEVNDEDMFETDEACVVYEDDDRYELCRILARSTGNMDLDEALVDGSSWAADSLVCSVVEFENVPFRNEDGTPSNRGRAFLQVRNNHATNSAIFYVRVLPMSLGVLR